MTDKWNYVMTELEGTSIKKRKNYTHPLIPPLDPDYIWPGFTSSLIRGLENDERVLLIGHASTSKSSCVQQLAHHKQQPLSRVNLNHEISTSDFLGHYVLSNGRTEYQYGVLPTAMREGNILLLDELNAMQPAIAFILQSVLEPSGVLLIPETGEYIQPHPEFKIVATANAGIHGDSTGLYSHGTHSLNYAFLDRWDMVIKTSFLPKKEECRVLRKKFPSLPAERIQKVVEAAASIRHGFESNNFQTPITLRSLISLCRGLERGQSFSETLSYAVLEKAALEDQPVIREVFQRFVGITT